MKAKEGPAPLPPGHHGLLQELAASQRPTVRTKWNLIRAIGERVPLSAPVSHVTRGAGAGDDKVWEPWRGTQEGPWGGMASGRDWGRLVTRLREQAPDLSPLFPGVTTHCGTEGLGKHLLWARRRLTCALWVLPLAPHQRSSPSGYPRPLYSQIVHAQLFLLTINIKSCI